MSKLNLNKETVLDFVNGKSKGVLNDKDNVSFLEENLNALTLHNDHSLINYDHVNEVVNNTTKNTDGQNLNCNQLQVIEKSSVYISSVTESCFETNTSQNVTNVFNDTQVLFNTFLWNDLTICLICETAFCPTDIIQKPFDRLNHWSSNEHRLNLASLFKKCFQDPDCESTEAKTLYISNSSYIDFSEFNQYSSFIFIDEKCISCTICKDRISPLLHSNKELVETILNHLKNERHFRNLQDNISWVSMLPSRAGCLMFYKTFIHCSICNKSIFCKEHNLLFIAVHHLDHNHPQIWLSCDFDKIQIKNLNESENHLESLSVNSDCVSNNSCSSDSDCDSSSDSWFDVESEFIESDLETKQSKEYSKDEFLTFECNDFFDCNDSCNFCSNTAADQAESRVKDSLVQPQHNTNNLSKHTHGEDTVVNNEFKRSVDLCSNKHGDNVMVPSEGSLLCENGNACLECGEGVEMFNNDSEFSLQLHSQKHKTIINNSVKVENFPSIFDENVDYVCPKCDEVISVFNKNINLSFTLHYQDCASNLEESVTAHDEVETNYKFLSKVFDFLPKKLKKNRKFITIDDGFLFCKLCNCRIIVKGSIYRFSVILRDNFSLEYHMNQYEMVTESTKVDCMDNKTKLKPSATFVSQQKTEGSINYSVQNSSILEGSSSMNTSHKYTKDNTVETYSTSQNQFSKVSDLNKDYGTKGKTVKDVSNNDKNINLFDAVRESTTDRDNTERGNCEIEKLTNMEMNCDYKCIRDNELKKKIISACGQENNFERLEGSIPLDTKVEITCSAMQKENKLLHEENKKLREKLAGMERKIEEVVEKQVNIMKTLDENVIKQSGLVDGYIKKIGDLERKVEVLQREAKNQNDNNEGNMTVDSLVSVLDSKVSKERQYKKNQDSNKMIHRPFFTISSTPGAGSIEAKIKEQNSSLEAMEQSKEYQPDFTCKSYHESLQNTKRLADISTTIQRLPEGADVNESTYQIRKVPPSSATLVRSGPRGGLWRAPFRGRVRAPFRGGKYSARPHLEGSN